MAGFPTEQIRNVALVGHNGSGKTTLAEAIAYNAKLIARKGRVEDGNTISDFEPEEQQHLFSVSSALISFEQGGYKFNIIDTPGFPDFFYEVQAAIEVVDLAIFVVSAIDKVESQTLNIWKLCVKKNIPRMIFVNKLDKERADFDDTLESLRDTFGAGIAPLHYPIGSEANFNGVIDLLSDQAYSYSASIASPTAIPEQIADKEHSIHDNLIEGIVVADDSLMERYLEGDTPSYKELEGALALGVKSGVVYPTLLGSALCDIGIDLLIKMICEIGPSPLDRPPLQIEIADKKFQIQCSTDSEPLALVYKTTVDPFVGMVSYLKVLSGELKNDLSLYNPRTKTNEKLHGLFSLFGNKQSPISCVGAGDFCCVAKLSSTMTGDTLVDKATPLTVPLPITQQANHIQAIAPQSQGDDDKLMTSLRKLQEESVVLGVAREEQSHQILLSTTGDLHFTIICQKLARKFSVKVDTIEIIIPYRETITVSAKAEGKYKKQSGGHGQYGVASLAIEPLERGKYFEFHDQIVGGAIPKQFLPAVEKGALEAMVTGGKYGFPIVDVSVTCYDGKYHPVDSSEMSFKMAGLFGFREAYTKAEPVVLEPIDQVIVTVPASIQGDVLGDLNSKRAKIVSTDLDEEGQAVISALVPAAELRRYALELKALSSARGSFTREHAHYDVAPQLVVSKLQVKDAH